MVETGSVSAAEFRAACGLFPSGVTVVTRRLRDGRRYGMTVSSFTSVSLDPPLILVCIDKQAGFRMDLQPGDAFAVNVLREDQRDLAVRFSALPEHRRFEDLPAESTGGGSPAIRGVAIFDCVAQNAIEAGDHEIIVGRVAHIARHPGRALVWCESNYHYLPKLEA